MPFPKVALSEFCTIVAGGRRKLTGKHFVANGYPAIGAGGTNGLLPEWEFEGPGVVLGSVGTCGKCYRMSGRWITLANTQVIIPDPEVADANFLWFQLNDPSRWPLSGTAQPFIKSSDVKAHLVALPSLAEQRRIAAVLDQVNELRAKRRAALALLDTLTESIFLDMFGDPVSNPLGWPVAELSSLGRLDRGVSRHRPRNEPALLGGAYPLVQTGDVARSGGYITKFTATYSDLGLAQSKLWPAGTLCITIAANIARTGILTFDACFPDSVVGFTGQSPAYGAFVQSILSFHQKRLEEAAPESAQKNINLAVLRGLTVPTPPPALVESFAVAVATLRSVHVSGSGSQIDLDDFFASLQRRAFRGEL